MYNDKHHCKKSIEWRNKLQDLTPSQKWVDGVIPLDEQKCDDVAAIYLYKKVDWNYILILVIHF